MKAKTKSVLTFVVGAATAFVFVKVLIPLGEALVVLYAFHQAAYS